MPIRIKCQCGKVLNVKKELAGKAVKCPGCGKAVRVGAKRPSESASGSTAAKKPAAQRPAAPGGEGLDDLFAEEGFSKPVAAVCPACGAEMKADAVLCTRCGFNKQTGQRLEGHKMAGVDVDHGTLALQRAASDIQKDQALQDKMLNKSGLPWWLLGLILFVIITGTSIAVLAVNASRNVNEEVTFDPMATFLAISGGGFTFVAAVALLLVVVKGFQRRSVWKPLATVILAGAIGGGLLAAASSRGAF